MPLSVGAPVQSPVSTRDSLYPPPPLTTPAPATPASEMAKSEILGPRRRTTSGMPTPVLSRQSSDDVTAGVRAIPDLPDTAALPSRRKAPQPLRLPSFNDLDRFNPAIAPTALLTPPDEPTLANLLPTEATMNPPAPRPRPLAEAPVIQAPSNLTPPPSELPRASSEIRKAVTVTSPQGSTSKAYDTPSTGGEAPETHTDSAAILPTPISLVVSTVIKRQHDAAVFDVLSHTQPCPLPIEENPTSAFNELLTDLVTQVPPCSSIQVTHAVPLRFSMGQVPHSPSLTPNLSRNQEPADYFSVPSTFSKAVIVGSHQDAVRSAMPASPHPIVAPTTVHVSVLERYIPPTTPAEVHDLFSTTAPSALVDRLTELSADRGSLLFVYPTKLGAQTFNTHYLGPLLHPLLRRISGVHGLMSNLGTNVARMESIDAIPDYTTMQHWLASLLSSLNIKPSSKSSTSSPAHQQASTPPRFEIVHSSCESIRLDRHSWQTWYLHQEKARIQDVVARYFNRGLKLPPQPGITAGAICREILQGLEKEDYTPPAVPSHRPKVEVGCFVIQRTRR